MYGCTLVARFDGHQRGAAGEYLPGGGPGEPQGSPRQAPVEPDGDQQRRHPARPWATTTPPSPRPIARARRASTSPAARLDHRHRGVEPHAVLAAEHDAEVLRQEKRQVQRRRRPRRSRWSAVVAQCPGAQPGGDADQRRAQRPEHQPRPEQLSAAAGGPGDRADAEELLAPVHQHQGKGGEGADEEVEAEVPDPQRAAQRGAEEDPQHHGRRLAGSRWKAFLASEVPPWVGASWAAGAPGADEGAVTGG